MKRNQTFGLSIYMRIHICDLNAESPETGAHYGGRGFSHSSLSKVLLALIVLQMRPAKAINATWAAPEGTADTFLEVLDKTIMSYMKKNNPINDELPPLWSTFWFYQKAHTYCRLGFDSVLSAPFKSIGIPLEPACWKSAATPGQRRRLRKEREESRSH